MRQTIVGALLGAVGVMLLACGGDATPPAASPPSATPTAATPGAPAAPASPAAPAAAAPAPAPAVAAAAPAVDPDPPLPDPNESAGPIAMKPEFDKKKAKSSFPKKTASEPCWSSVSPTGDHAKDYAAIVAACGTPTGLVEYTKPQEGTLHHKYDPVDIFTMPVYGGYCYRYFAIADSTIKDIDLLIEKKGGDLVGADKTDGPFAIIDTDKPWCQDDDANLEFHVKIDGLGKGGYTFGVWARPNK